MSIIKIFLLSFTLAFKGILNPELIIGKERVDPGIIFIFEGAIKDQISPISMHLSENLTNVHIEARVNWDTNNIPKGTPIEGFVPYLNISATITNQYSGLLTFIDLKPHINLVDNFHYARNISLPGKINELYTVEFSISPPTELDLAIHKDWLGKFGKQLISNYRFEYKNINFNEIAKAKRN
tara:strand:- start:408 stop:953 length:546 start_codon:yes stop_codon:yes gene_type:complete